MRWRAQYRNGERFEFLILQHDIDLFSLSFTWCVVPEVLVDDLRESFGVEPSRTPSIVCQRDQCDKYEHFGSKCKVPELPEIAVGTVAGENHGRRGRRTQGH